MYVCVCGVCVCVVRVKCEWVRGWCGCLWRVCVCVYMCVCGVCACMCVVCLSCVYDVVCVMWCVYGVCGGMCMVWCVCVVCMSVQSKAQQQRETMLHSEQYLQTVAR